MEAVTPEREAKPPRIGGEKELAAEISVVIHQSFSGKHWGSKKH